ncbi:MAG: T9SS type A sorting domain-containing protein [Flavobacteriia bacterium]|nr:T9SS type A sorting domain-containing protein [Flavobacteriia bacterium]
MIVSLSALSQGAQTTIPCPAGSVNTTLPGAGFSGDDPTTAAGSCGQCCYAGSDIDGDGDQDVSFSIENSKWFKYCNATASTLTQTFAVDENNNNCNLQGAIFVGTNASPNNASDALDIDCSNNEFNEYGSNMNGNADGFSFGNIDIAPGQCAYIMVDGYAGATCPDGFTISTSCATCTAPTSITESVDVLICEGASTGLTATAVGGIVSPSVFYKWAPATGLSCTNCQSPTATPSATTTYTVTACNDGAGLVCCTTDQVVVSVTPTFVANAGTDIVACAGATVTLGGAPTGPVGSTYTWAKSGANNAAFSNPSGNVANPTVTIAGGTAAGQFQEYQVTVVNGACTRTDIIRVTAGTLAVSAGPDLTICAGTTAVIGGLPTAPPGSTYVWTETVGDNTNPSTGNVTLSATNTANPTVNASSAAVAGNVTYRVTATLSGCSNFDDVVVTISAIPTTPTATPSVNPVCAGAATVLTAAGGAGAGTYTWWDAAAGGAQLAAGNTYTVSPVATTTYYVMSTNATPCNSLRGSVTINVTPTPVANAGIDVEVCQNTAFNLAGSVANPGACAPAQTWSVVSGTGNFGNVNALNSSFTPTSSGTIVLRLTPCTPGGCAPVSDDITITSNPAPTVTAGATDVDFCAGQITDLFCSAVGGTPAPDVLIPSGPFSSAAGPFAIPDNNAQGVVIPITVSGVPNATLGLSDLSDLTVNVDHNRIGQVEVWLCPPGVSPATPYTGCVLAFDNNGGNGDDLVNTVFSDVAATDIASGTAPFTGSFNLAGAGVFTSLDGQATNGTWNVVVLDNSGGGATTGTAGQMSMNFSTSVPNPIPYTYSWSTAAGLSSTVGDYITLSAGAFAPPTAITKTVTVTDDNGCTDTDNVTINLRATPTATITSGTTDLCPVASGIGSSTASVSIDFTGFATWEYTGVRDGTPDAAPTTTNSDPTTYSINYADVAALGDQTMVFTMSSFKDNYCPGTIINSHTVTAFCLLPVELISFTGENIIRKNELNWITASETNNNYFSVEKSENGLDYFLLSKVSSLNGGNSLNSSSYTLIDENPYEKGTYYKLIQTDIDGKDKFLSQIFVDNNKNETLVIMPNPINDYFVIQFSSDSNQETKIQVTDIFGRVIYKDLINSMNNKYEKIIDSKDFKDGVYFLDIENKFLKERYKINKISKL